MQKLINLKDCTITVAPHPKAFDGKTVIEFLVDKTRIVTVGDDIIAGTIKIPKHTNQTVYYSIIGIENEKDSKSYPDKKIITARVFRHVS